MRVLIFGDSITQGFWDTKGGWAERIIERYSKRAIQNRKNRYFATVFNLGISGDKSDSVLQRMRAEIEARKWHDEELVLVFAIGTNNTYVKNDKPYSSIDQYSSDVKEIVTISKEYAKKIMFVGLSSCDEQRTKPVFWDNVVWENNRLKEFNAALEKICREHNVPFVPIFEKFQEEQNTRNLLEDGIHPNSKGHQFIADLVLPELDKLVTAH